MMNSKPGKTPTSFRFSKETNRLLKILCESWGVNRNEAVERAIALSTFMDSVVQVETMSGLKVEEFLNSKI
jgi:hypothetical protein